MRRITALAVLVCAAIAVATGLATAKGTNGKKKPHVCSGTTTAPGTLSGTFKSGVVIKGVCYVNAGPAKVIGLLKLDRGSALAAAFGGNNSHLTVDGNVVIKHRATLILGCNTTSFTCIDETNMTNPTLSSHGRVTGNITGASPLGVLVHSTTILGNVTQTGGGGGVNCTPQGPFMSFQSPVYSTYEDSTVKGTVTITGLHTCWLGLARLHVRRSVKVLSNRLADDDGIEVVSNHFSKNLVCRHNSHPTAGEQPGTEPVWDSAENPMNPMGVIYPRIPQPNTVDGKRVGQCSRSTPLTLGGPRGPKGSF